MERAEWMCDKEETFLPVPECNSLALEHPHLVGEPGDERRLAQELLLGNGPEVASGEVLGRRARLQVVLPVQPSQPQELAVTVEGVTAERQRKGGGGQHPRRG